MNAYYKNKIRRKPKENYGDFRIRIIAITTIVFGIIISIRLFMLMILQHGLYTALAAGTHEIYSQLIPERGNIYLQDSRSGEEFPLALNREMYTIFVDTRELKTEEDIEDTLEGLNQIFGYEEQRRFEVFLLLSKKDDPYEPIEKKVSEEIVEKLREKELPGIGFVEHQERYYPEGRLGSHVVGFVGQDNSGNTSGRYGIEGYLQEKLAGKGGFLEAAKSVEGKWIPLAGRSLESAQDGADIVLTLDRTLQFTACERLRSAMEEYKATSASLIIMDPKSGAILTMCSLPDFDPNKYNEVESIDVYNNTTIFTPYEPGSVFKPITMSAVLEEELASPFDVFHDTGEADAHCIKPIKNAGGESYGDVTMTGILENSINTGMVYAVKLLGKKKFIEYAQNFGFGVRSGIDLETEISGTIDTLYKKKGDEVDCYTATASFGQGITATPLQITSAFATIANGGVFMQPNIVKEIRYKDGRIERWEQKEIKRVISGRAASLISAMLVKVVDNGHAGEAGVSGYYVAGKTGTAQIAGPGGYTDETNHSFVGFAPVDDPKFVMLVKFEKPQRAYSATTAAPVFGDIAKFILKYYGVPPSR